MFSAIFITSFFFFSIYISPFREISLIIFIKKTVFDRFFPVLPGSAREKTGIHEFSPQFFSSISAFNLRKSLCY